MTSEEAKEWLSPETSPMKIHMSELNGENPMKSLRFTVDVTLHIIVLAATNCYIGLTNHVIMEKKLIIVLIVDKN